MKYEIIKEINSKFLKVEGVKFEGNNSVFERINKHSATAMLLCSNDWSKMFLVKQYRVGSLKEMWEVPAGILEKELTPVENMLKEIEEETGFSKNDVVDVKEEMKVYVSPGYTSEIIYLFSARVKEGAERKELMLDENEFISDTGFFTLDEAKKMGAMEDLKTASLILIFEKIQKNMK